MRILNVGDILFIGFMWMKSLLGFMILVELILYVIWFFVGMIVIVGKYSSNSLMVDSNSLMVERCIELSCYFSKCV